MSMCTHSCGGRVQMKDDAGAWFLLVFIGIPLLVIIALILGAR